MTASRPNRNIEEILSQNLDDPNLAGIMENVEKLKSRYPGGKFETFFSENRKENDL